MGKNLGIDRDTARHIKRMSTKELGKHIVEAPGKEKEQIKEEVAAERVEEEAEQEAEEGALNYGA